MVEPSINNLVIHGVKKIVVLRALVLGDLIFALPALDALHRTYSDAEIVYLGRPWVADFIRNRVPGIGRVFTFRPSEETYADLGYLIDKREAETLLPMLKSEQFDLAIQMQGGGRNSNPLIKRLGARVSVGSKEPDAIPLDRWIPFEYHQNETVRFLDVVALAGAHTTEIHPRLKVLDSDLEAAAAHIERLRQPYMVIHSGARDVRRRWPAAHFARLADDLIRQLGMEVVLTGTADIDHQQVNAIVEAMEETPINLCGELDLPAMIGLLAQATLVVSNDTGPLHLALAVGTRVVGLYWEEYVIKSLPLSRNHFYPLIAWERRCPTCGKYMDKHEVVRIDAYPCRHETSFIASITPEEVFKTVKAALE